MPKKPRKYSDPNTLTLNIPEGEDDGIVTLDREIIAEDHDDDDIPEPRIKAHRKFFHKEEGLDVDDGEHADEVEEELAIQMDKDQKTQLQDTDFLLPGMDDAAAAAATPIPDPSASVAVENVEREFARLSKAEKLEVLSRDSPELMPLLSEYKSNMRLVKQVLQPLLEKAKAGLLPSSQGLSFLQMKFHLLVLYCLHIAFYMLLKVEGRRVKDHPVVEKLVELRLYIQKLAPLEKKLEYTINKLLSLANLNVEELAKRQDDESAGPETSLRPRLDRLVPVEADEQAQQKREAGIYQAPKNPLTVVSEENKVKKRKRAAEQLLKDIRQYEDSNLKELRLSREQKKLLKKAAQDMQLSHRNIVSHEDSFEPNDEDMDDEDLTLLQFIEKKRKVALRAQHEKEAEESAAAEAAIKAAADESGAVVQDEEITSEDTDAGSAGDAESSDDGGDVDDGEDEVYQKAKQAVQRKKEKAEKKKRPRAAIEEEEEEDGDDDGDGATRRKATKKIISNRGLVAPKKKILRTPRLKTRYRYKKQLRRHKSQVPQVKEARYNSYSGEGSIKDRVIRSKPM